MARRQMRLKEMPIIKPRREAANCDPTPRNAKTLEFVSGINRAKRRRMSIITFRDLEAWKQGMDLVECCYKATRHFPAEERYGLTGQIRRAAISIPTNVAEGHCRRTTRAYANHISIACGSEGERETCIELADRLGHLVGADTHELMRRCTDIGRILTGLHGSLERKLLAASEPGGRRRQWRFDMP